MNRKKNLYMQRCSQRRINDVYLNAKQIVNRASLDAKTELLQNCCLHQTTSEAELLPASDHVIIRSRPCLPFAARVAYEGSTSLHRLWAPEKTTMTTLSAASE